jgi:hypothetical protein
MKPMQHGASAVACAGRYCADGIIIVIMNTLASHLHRHPHHKTSVNHLYRLSYPKHGDTDMAG